MRKAMDLGWDYGGRDSSSRVEMVAVVVGVEAL